ncbi:MAG TPA: hypothetical protein VF265_08905 [Nevskiaceae bacterium]
MTRVRLLAMVGVAATALALAGCPHSDDNVTASNAPVAVASGGGATTGVTRPANGSGGDGATSPPAPSDSSSAEPEAPIGAPVARANIGVNTDWVSYWSTAQPFVDMVRQAANFDDPATHTSLARLGRLDRDGWPTSDFYFMVVCCLQPDGSDADPGPTTPLAGDYQLSFTGQANISPLAFSVTNQRYDAATNITTATLTIGQYASNFMLGFSQTRRTPGSPVDSGVTNIRIIRPQYAPNGAKWWDTPDQEFTNPFLDSFKGFSTIRYMNWTGAINSPEVDWSDRTPADWPVAEHEVLPPSGSLPYLVPQQDNWQTTKMSWESAIDLANATHTDMWINIPTMATDDYVKSLAALIQQRLNPNLHVYVEWSDEIWNYGNPYWTETNYNHDQVEALKARDPQAAANYAAHCDPANQDQCHVAERVMQFGQDFASVYGQSAINTTIRPVLCMQFVNPAMLAEALRFIAETYGPPSKYFYGTCGAPYFATPLKDPANATVDDVVAATDAGIPANTWGFQVDTALSILYGLRNLTYEGGTGLPEIGASAELQAAANLAPGLGASVTAGLTDFFRRGGDMYMYYSAMGSGGWGATNDQLNLDAPRYAALRALVGKPITRSAGTTLPASIPSASPVFGIDGDGHPSAYGATGWWMAAATDTLPAVYSFNGSTADHNGLAYLVNVANTATFQLSLVLDDRGPRGNTAIEMDVDGTPVVTFPVAPAPSNTPATLGPAAVTLTAGLHVVSMRNAGPAGGGFTVRSIDFQ